MLQAHSFLWHYLWVAPNVYLFILGLLIWRRGLNRQIPAFLAFALLSSSGQLSVYLADIVPSVSAGAFWQIDWVSLSLEALLKFFVFGEVFSRVFSPYPSVSKIGKYLVSAVGAFLVLIAAVVAGLSRGDSTFRLISGAHLLELTVFMVQCGLIVFVFLLAAYFRMPWDRLSFGILLGFGLASCVHLATWATMNNLTLSAYQRTLLDFVNMATYHVTVLIWYYYLLVPRKKNQSTSKDDSDDHRSDPPSAPSGGTRDHEESLDEWNREVERLIHQ